MRMSSLSDKEGKRIRNHLKKTLLWSIFEKTLSDTPVSSLFNSVYLKLSLLLHSEEYLFLCMSYIDRLSLIGIRSFGPTQRSGQALQFFRPVTIIVGHNGSGKTTIIEALKYAVTGELPPSSLRGQGFIFDPKVSYFICIYLSLIIVYIAC